MNVKEFAEALNKFTGWRVLLQIDSSLNVESVLTTLILEVPPERGHMIVFAPEVKLHSVITNKMTHIRIDEP